MSNKSKGKKHKHCWHKVNNHSRCEISGFLKFKCEDRLLSILPEDEHNNFEICCRCGDMK